MSRTGWKKLVLGAAVSGIVAAAFASLATQLIDWLGLLLKKYEIDIGQLFLFEVYLVLQTSFLTWLAIKYYNSITGFFKRALGQPKEQELGAELDALLPLIKECLQFLNSRMDNDDEITPSARLAGVNVLSHLRRRFLELGLEMPVFESDDKRRDLMVETAFVSILQINIKEGRYERIPELFRFKL